MNRVVEGRMGKEGLKEGPRQTAWISDETVVQKENCKFKGTEMRACWTYIRHGCSAGVKIAGFQKAAQI